MQTPKLNIPMIAPGQAQKHVTHNEALMMIDDLMQLAVIRADLTAPPANPSEGDSYIVAEGATGVWAGKAQTIAVFRDGDWLHYTPRTGWRCHLSNTGVVAIFGQTQWSTSDASERVEKFGVGANADQTNRLSVAGTATLFSGVASGHQVKINKSAAADTAALLFQTNFSGRAEFGLTGSDNCQLKVSPDGNLWRNAMIVDRTTATVEFPFSPGAANPNLFINGDFQINQRAFNGGALAAGAFAYDRWRAGAQSGNLSLSGDRLTLNSGTLVQTIEPAMWGRTGFAGSKLAISVEAPSANLQVQIGNATAVIAAGAGQCSVVITVPATETGSLSVQFSAATAGAVTFGRVKAELANNATPFVARPRTIEEQLCFRYFYAFGGVHYVDAYQNQGGYISRQTSVPVLMRAVPTFTFSIVDSSNVDSVDRGVQVLSRSVFSIYGRLATNGRGYVGVNNITLSAEI